MAYGRYIKKKAGQATKAVGKRYGVSYGRKGVQMKKNSVAKIAKDLMWVKSRLNTEKKFIDSVIFERSALGQVDVNAEGLLAYNITPAIAQGTGEGNRVGNSLKATGMTLHMNFIKQAGAGGTRRCKVMIVRSLKPADSPLDVLDNNPLTGLRDYHSNLDYTEFKDKAFSVVATRYVKLDEDSSGASTATGEVATATLKFALKLNDVFRYETNGDTYPANIRYHIIVLCDNGNKGLSASTNPGVMVKGVQTGVDVQCHRRMWYVDN